jgi:hypothetical protein
MNLPIATMLQTPELRIIFLLIDVTMRLAQRLEATMMQASVASEP